MTNSPECCSADSLDLPKAPFFFRRYVNGVEMAESVEIGSASTVQEAFAKARAMYGRLAGMDFVLEYAVVPAPAQTSQVPEGYVLVPRELTAENGAKSVLIGEFSETFDYMDEDGDECASDIPISWTTIKAIHKKMVAHFAAAQPTAAPVETASTPEYDDKCEYYPYFEMLWKWFEERRGKEDMRANAIEGLSVADFKSMLDEHEAELTAPTGSSAGTCRNCNGTKKALYFSEQGMAHEERDCHVCRSQCSAATEDVAGAAQFLLDRLDEFDPGDDEPEREYHGHVAPAIARLRSALTEAVPQPVGVRDAIIEECAKLVEPKRPRPCDCERCDCGNSGDLEAVAAWDADAANAKAIRSLSLSRQGERS